MAEPSVIEATSRPAAGAFLARLVRLDPRALVRLRPVVGARPPGGAVDPAAPPEGAGAGPGEPPPAGPVVAELWASLPFGVLVARAVRTPARLDATVRAAELLEALAAGDRPGSLPRRRDLEWRWSLPADPGVEIERVPAADVLRIAEAAATTVRALAEGATGRAVGQRALRDALLDHVPLVVTAPDGPAAEIPQRLVQGVVRMGFVADGYPVGVRVTGRWTGLAGHYGMAWYRR